MVLVARDIEPISLTKGVEISLEKVAETSNTTLKRVKIGLKWDKNEEEGGDDFDTDRVVIVTDANDQFIPGIMPVYYYKNLKNENDSIVLSRDERTGETEGYDEVADIDLERLPPQIEKIRIGVSIHDAVAREQNFGQISNAECDIIDADTGNVVININMTKNLSDATALEAVLLTKEAGTWSCKYVGVKFVSGGLEAFLNKYGITVQK